MKFNCWFYANFEIDSKLYLGKVLLVFRSYRKTYCSRWSVLHMYLDSIEHNILSFYYYLVYWSLSELSVSNVLHFVFSLFRYTSNFWLTRFELASSTIISLVEIRNTPHNPTHIFQNKQCCKSETVTPVLQLQCLHTQVV